MSSAANWADVDEEEYLPPTETSVDDKGIKTIVEYSKENGKLVKTTRRLKQVVKTRKVVRGVAERSKWAPFGKAVSRPEEAQSIVSKDDVQIEDPKSADGANDKQTEDMLQRVISKFAETQVKREMEARGLASKDDSAARLGKGAHYNPELAAQHQAGAKTVREDGKYLPPSMRGEGGGAGSRFGDRDDSNTLRVTNISEDAQERDLQELFRKCGQVARVYLAKDRDTGISRGFAYVSYVRREDAEAAMATLNGYGYDHLILKIEWAHPQENSDRPPVHDAMKYASGYGKALPQG